ncbi:MAG: hypothetical protein OEV30_11040 [Ignavibacteria bacterium]|nr:hypothetical protein [Ignavibacteria bacterium]
MTLGKSEGEKTTARADLTLFEFSVILVRWRMFIAKNLGIVILLSVVVSLLMPNWYSSTVSLLPPKKSGSLFGQVAGFSTAMKDITKTLGAFGESSEEVFNYLAILKSRTALTKVINRFNLREVYDFDEDAPIEDLLAELESNVALEVQEEGNITLTVYDKDPVRASEMANYFVSVLNDVSTDLSTQDARNNREFIEHRYQQVMEDLRTAEDSLQMFQEKHGVYALPEQTKAAIEAAAELKSQILFKEVEIGYLQRVFGMEAPKIRSAQAQVRELSAKFNQMQHGEPDGSGARPDALFPALKDLPEIGADFVRLFRAFEIQNRLLEFIVPIYEQARIEEQKTIPVVMVLDKATPAEQKSRPKRSIIVVIATALAFIVSVTVVLSVEAFRKLQNTPARYARIQREIIDPLWSSLSAIRNRIRRTP